VGTSVFEGDSGAVDEVFDGARHKDLPGIRQRCDSRRDVDGDSADVVTAPFALTGVQAASNIDADPRYAISKSDGAQNRSRGAV
jgi:hypothetical protein